jgi:phosphatidate cytidylyltransferase
MVTAAVVAPIIFGGALIGGGVWFVVMSITAALGLIEFFNMTRLQAVRGNGVIGLVCGLVLIGGAHLQLSPLWIGALILAPLLTFFAVLFQRSLSEALGHGLVTLLGVIYIAVPAALLVDLLNKPAGFSWEVLIFSVTITTDTAAYFGGRFFGKRQLAPKLSPKKTVEGAAIGIGVAVVVVLILLGFSGMLVPSLIVMALIAPPLAVLGDLLESALKRYFQVKDSHITGINILPGHGGVLDRIDSLLIVTPFVYGWLLLFGFI